MFSVTRKYFCLLFVPTKASWNSINVSLYHSSPREDFSTMGTQQPPSSGILGIGEGRLVSLSSSSAELLLFTHF